jgi:hypothetical protein
VIRRNLIALSALACGLILPASAQAGFGIEPGSLRIASETRDGVIESQAGSHPYALEVRFALNTEPSGKTEGGVLRDVITDLPPGLFGNPTAVPACRRVSFEGALPNCSPSTQVGIVNAVLPETSTEFTVPVYNLKPPPGVAAQLGFAAVGFTALLSASVDPGREYGVHFEATNLPLEASLVDATIWGTPADPSHDPERGPTGEGRGSDAPVIPYLTLPTSCDDAPAVTIAVDSKQNPGDFVSATAQLLDSAGNPLPLSGCETVPFSPKIASQPTSRSASNPSGLDFELKLPNQGLLASGSTTESEPRKTVVTLPEGVTVNPSFAEGISVCTEAQYEAEQIDTPAGAGCPEASKLGSVIAQSPLLEEPVEGSVYLAAPYENEFGTLAALYLVARAPERGIIVKQAGKVEFDPVSGQITTTFDHLPPIPYSSFKLHFREGARAPMVTPQSCGEYKTVGKFTPFSAESDEEALETTASFQIEHGAEGGACPGGGLPPFKPGLIAGSINNAAGHFSPFDVRLFRTDAEQEITHFSIKLPPGITGKLAGIPYCSDQAIEAAKARTGPHGGAEELASPSCPAASEVGHSLAGAGVGNTLAYVPGKIYMAGPYHGSNLSIVAITAAKAGPFDLGTVVVREALQINPETAEVFIDATGSDPIPHIIRGVPVYLRDIRAYVDKPEFVLNPTDCTPTSTASTLLGSGLNFASEADDNPVTVSTRYQAADCASLPFKPQLSLRLIGRTNRGAHPKFVTHLAMKGIGEAAIDHAQVTLPRSEFIENAHFNTICTRVQFKEGAGNGAACPSGSIYGHAKAITPLLSEPVQGNVFLRSSEHQLPDLVVALHNSQVDFDLVGRVDSVKGGGLRTTFETAPDAPVTSFDLELEGGSKGLFVNSTDLCAKKHRAKVAFVGQNGKAYDAKPLMRVKCPKAHKRHGKHHSGR